MPRRNKDGRISGAELRCSREHFGLSQAQLATLLGTSRQSVVAWENGVTPVPDWAADNFETVSEQYQGAVVRRRDEPGDTIEVPNGDGTGMDGLPVSWFRSVAYEAAYQSGKHITYQD